MIILGLKAENILKYELLEVSNIPEKGLIGVRGPNEAGKSTVAEAICLGLYGRTFGFEASQFDKSIKWGTSNSSIELKFRLGESETFVVNRFFDLDGNHSARITREGSSKALAQGPQAVTAEIARLTGCDFQQYVDAFYLAQREFSIPHAQSDMLKGLLGVAELDNVGDELLSDIRRDSESVEALKERAQEAENRMRELAIRDGELDDLKESREAKLADQQAAEASLTTQVKRNTKIQENTEALKFAIDDARSIPANAPYEEWVEFGDSLSQPFIALECAIREDAFADADLSGVESWVTDVEKRIDSVEALVIEAQTHAEERQNWLTLSGNDEESESASVSSEPSYPDAKAKLETEQAPVASRRRSSGISAVLFLLLGSVSGAIWYVLTRMSDSDVYTKLNDWIGETIPQFTAEHYPFLLGAAGLFGILFLVFTIRSAKAGSQLQKIEDERFRLERKAERAQQDIARIKDLAKGSLTETLERLAALEHEQIASDAEEFLKGPGLELITDEGWNEHTSRCEHIEASLDIAKDRLLPQLEKAVSHAEEQLRATEQAVNEADASISNEQARLDEHAGLEEQIKADNQAMEMPNDRIAVREVAIELLKGSSRRIYTHFNLQLREYLGSLLPLFTEGRYQHLKIDDAFNVQVFSLEKNDFVGLDDLSSGTQRQLILAIRLAMSQALVDSRKSGKQTLILDEPFAFFDRERMRQTLDTFTEFSPEIQQIWVISQEFDESSSFDLMLDCDRDSDRMSITA